MIRTRDKRKREIHGLEEKYRKTSSMNVLGEYFHNLHLWKEIMQDLGEIITLTMGG